MKDINLIIEDYEGYNFKIDYEDFNFGPLALRSLGVNFKYSYQGNNFKTFTNINILKTFVKKFWFKV